jgi:hypothetical protein
MEFVWRSEDDGGLGFPDHIWSLGQESVPGDLSSGMNHLKNDQFDRVCRWDDSLKALHMTTVYVTPTAGSQYHIRSTFAVDLHGAMTVESECLHYLSGATSVKVATKGAQDESTSFEAADMLSDKFLDLD